MPCRLVTNYPTREIGRQIDAEAIKRHAFNNHGIVVAKVDDHRLNDFERQFLKNIGARLFGPKRSRAAAL